MKLVIHPPVDSERFQKIQSAAGDMLVVNCGSPDKALEHVLDADAFFGKITAELLERAGKLRWIQSPTASLEHYVFPALIDHPCMLTNMRGLFSDVIADHVMGYIVCFARNLHIYIRQQFDEVYEPVGGESARSSFATGPGVVSDIDRSHKHLADQTLGIVGLGAIGSEIARRAQAFGMKVVSVDPVNPAAWPMDCMGELLSMADFLVIAAPHTPKTAGLFRLPLLRQMKPSCYLINIGRGAIVILDDLVQALNEGALAGAALDVYEVEPLPKGHPLWKMPNVILTPHVAGYSPRIPERHLATLLENVSRFARGKEMINVVNKAEWF